MRRKKLQKQRKIIITFSFILLITLSVGYASFQTNINLNAKGNLYNKGDLCYETKDNQDGTVTITNYDASCGSEVNIPEKIKGKTVTKIGDTTWEVGKNKSFSRKGLTKVKIPDTVTYIGTWAFYANDISNLDLGNGVIEIANEAFHQNILTTITFPKTLKKIGRSCFLSNYLTQIPPLDNIEYGGGAFTFNNLNPEDAFIYDRNADGSINYSSLNSYAARRYVDTLNIPEGVKILSEKSLRKANVKTINLPEGIEIINNGSFHQSTVKIINIPSSIKEIHSDALNEVDGVTVNINRKENSVSNAPWCAISATINWTGTN